MKIHTIEDAMKFIHGTTWKGSVLGLSRISELVLHLGSPQKKLRFVHIAGTNGKGSTAAMLASVLQAAGHKTGLFTSPFVHKFNELIQINGAAVSDDALILLAVEVARAAEKMSDKPTEYEIITALAFLHFFREGCDIVVLEVGMGGRLDSTNVIDTPEVAIITAIGLDHMAQLGGTIEKIAREKAGIIKQGGAVVCHPQAVSVERVLREKCAEMDAAVTFVSEAEICSRGNVSEAERFLEAGNGAGNGAGNESGNESGNDFPDGQKFYYRGENFTVSLLGEHQLRNAAVVIETVEILRARGWEISEKALQNGLRETVWPGRFEVLRRDPVFIVDTAHNPQGVAATLATLEKIAPGVHPIVIFGVLEDKDFIEMARLLSDFVPEKFVLVTPENPRALPASELKKYVTGDAVVCESIAEGVAHTFEIAEFYSVIIALGSLSMIGKIRAMVKS
ncbi:MAG: bifunctional folylpolyglutamate synthase/dihydrofolate synthase [Defluviitaleaceae bacterium]|nr:bifunctional folylpolyglutamate synthase/dihydrofolate synthase [Defluviitaleaceae bacterium]